MTSALDVNDAVLVDFRTAVIILIRDKCERHEYIQTGNRLGDNAKTCFIELVDYNENMLKTKEAKKTTRTRRSRKAAAPAAEAPAAAETPAAEAPAAESAE